MQAHMDSYLPLLQARLTLPRFEHSLGVMQVMAELAPIYSLDSAQATTAGLLHDVARDLSGEEQLALAEEGGIELPDPCDRHPDYLHAPVGAYLVARDLSVTDPPVLDAIAAHSYARNGPGSDHPLACSLRSADLIASVREWPGREKLRAVVYAGRAEEAALLQCRWLIEYLEQQRVPVHPNLARRYQALLDKLAVPMSFFERC